MVEGETPVVIEYPITMPLIKGLEYGDWRGGRTYYQVYRRLVSVQIITDFQY